MIPLKQLIPELHHDTIQPPNRVIIPRDLSDMQHTVDLIREERAKERRENDTLMSTLIYSVWRRR